MADDLRHRYAEAIRKAADFSIIAEWICCDPVNPKHKLCKRGDAARQMLRAVLYDDPETLFVPSKLADAVIGVRDKKLERLARELRIAEMRSGNWEAEAGRQRQRADHAEAEIGRLKAAIHRALHNEQSEEECTHYGR